MHTKEAERKVIIDLARAMDDKDAYLAKTRRYAQWTNAAAWVLLTLVFIGALGAKQDGLWLAGYTVVGFVGGVLFCLGFHTRHALVQWRVIRRFLDAEAVKKTRDEAQH